jgi:anti-anti-sigma regulatory factor
MKNKPEIKINLFDIYGHIVSSRASISVLLEKHTSKSDFNVVINFDKIHFLSRSSAQQIVLVKKQFENNNIKISYINIPFEVNKILELAEQTRIRKKIDVTEKDFSSNKEFEEFLLAF